MPCGIYWHRAELVLTWAARLWSIPTLILILGLIYGSISRAPDSRDFLDYITLLLAPGGVCLGILLGWRWQGFGGVVCSVSMIGFYFALRSRETLFPWEPYFLFFAVPGLLFFSSWLLECRRRRGIKVGRFMFPQEKGGAGLPQEKGSFVSLSKKDAPGGKIDG
jgi:hypothetical protein